MIVVVTADGLGTKRQLSATRGMKKSTLVKISCFKGDTVLGIKHKAALIDCKNSPLSSLTLWKFCKRCDVFSVLVGLCLCVYTYT